MARRFARFWYDFIVGDDWTITVAVVVVLAITDRVADSFRVSWAIVPIGVAVVLERVGRARPARPSPRGEQTRKGRNSMISYFQAIVIGVLQGVTELFPSRASGIRS